MLKECVVMVKKNNDFYWGKGSRRNEFEEYEPVKGR